MKTLTKEQLEIRAWGESHNAKVREELRLNELPTATELLESCVEVK